MECEETRYQGKGVITECLYPDRSGVHIQGIAGPLKLHCTRIGAAAVPTPNTPIKYTAISVQPASTQIHLCHFHLTLASKAGKLQCALLIH